MLPDLAGYREAQLRLVANLGTTVPFFTPTDVTWPPSEPIDPESGKPFDPTVNPVSSGFTSAGVKCGVVLRPIGLSRRGVEDDTVTVPLGRIEEGEGVLIAPLADYEEAELENATLAEVHGETYEITQTERDGLGEEDHRCLIYIRQA